MLPKDLASSQILTQAFQSSALNINFEKYKEVFERIDALPRNNMNALGVDPFGFDPESLKPLVPIMVWLYRNYFRCEIEGIENIPEGRMMVIANHAGGLPFDGAMIGCAFLMDALKPRLLRGMVDTWVAELPFIHAWYTRLGQITGLPKSCEGLLEANEAVLVFPEGMRAILKLYKDRYKLLKFGQGFMRCAMRTNAPIVPVAVIGSEEQAPTIAHILPLGKLMHLPAFPLIFPQLLPVPLPVKYRISIGKPMHFHGDAMDPERVSKNVEKVRKNVQGMLNAGLKKRESIFF
jgi:1-acyl-sn-glycerol-3-phosphate acyltransferase